MTPRNVTGLVDGLAGAGLVVRGPHPTDRRATLVSVADRGAAVAADLGAGQAALAGQLFDGLDADRLAGLVAGLDAVRDRLRELAPGAAS